MVLNSRSITRDSCSDACYKNTGQQEVAEFGKGFAKVFWALFEKRGTILY